MPEGIQLSRARGWRLPPGAMSVARPGRWGNPYALKREFSRADPLRCYLDEAVMEVAGLSLDGRAYDSISPVTPRVAVTAFEYWLHQAGRELLDAGRAVLAGKSLACWCPAGSPCHRDVWLLVANDQRGADAWLDLGRQWMT